MVLVFSNKNVQQNFNATTVKASLAFDNITEGDFDAKKAKKRMQAAYSNGSKGVFTESGEAMDWEAQKMKELNRESKRLIAKYPEKESTIISLTMEVAAENGYSLHYVGESMRYREIENFKKGETIKMEIASQNLPTTKVVTDTPPIFPGGEKEMLRFIYTNIKYPVEARSSGIYGEMTAQFIVEKDGSISNLKVKNDLGGGLKEEILRVMKLVQEMPTKWMPATKNGEAIRFTYELPFEYHLKDKNGDSPSFTKTHKGIHIVIIGYKADKKEAIEKTDGKGEIRLEKIDKNGVAHYRTIGKDANQTTNPILDNRSINGEPIYKVADEMPRFPGCGTANEYNSSLKSCGDKKMLQFIYENINYPKVAREQGIEGTVVVRFIVKKDGRQFNE